MFEVPIVAIPNQTMSIQLDNKQYDLAIYATSGVMAMDVVRDGVTLLTGQRVVSGYPVIPYSALEDGNFIFTTDNEEYPDYLQFGISQSLLFVTAAELSVLRASA